MDAAKNPVYLAAVAVAVQSFIERFEEFLQFHEKNTLAPGLMPSVFPRNDANSAEIAGLRAKVDEAAGLPVEAPVLTNSQVGVVGFGAIDPIANWSGGTEPKPLLDPTIILSARGGTNTTGTATKQIIAPNGSQDIHNAVARRFQGRVGRFSGPRASTTPVSSEARSVA